MFKRLKNTKNIKTFKGAKEWIYGKKIVDVFSGENRYPGFIIGWHSEIEGRTFMGYFIGGLKMILFRIRRKIKKLTKKS